MSEKEQMLRGELYNALDAELVAERARAERLLRRFRVAEHNSVIRDLLGYVGEGTKVREPFYCDYGYNISVGKDVFVNFGCVMLDVCPIAIGDGYQIVRACRSMRRTIRVIPRPGDPAWSLASR